MSKFYKLGGFFEKSKNLNHIYSLTNKFKNSCNSTQELIKIRESELIVGNQYFCHRQLHIFPNQLHQELDMFFNDTYNKERDIYDFNFSKYYE